jgi:uncharacterized OB-fold protein
MSNRPANSLPAEFAEINPDAWSEPFWLATREHHLVIPQCTKCSTFRFPPSPFCNVCSHQEVDLVRVSGEGSVYTYTVARHAVVSMLADNIPYVVAAIELDDAPGIRMIVNIVESDPDAVRIGSRVSVVWDDVNDEVTVPRFRLTA